MRFLMKVSLCGETGNEVIRSGKIGETIGRILEQQRPEAAYFTEEDGKRTGFIVVNIDHPYQIPSLCEPWFLAFDAEVRLHPAMTVQDLQKAGPDIEKAVKSCT